MKNKSIFIVGILPPPLRGMSYVNQQMFINLENLGFDVKFLKINIFGHRFLIFSKSLSVLFITAKFLASDSKKNYVVYLPVDSNYGLFFNLLLILCLKAKKIKIILHHHSYAYITSKKKIVFIINKLLKTEDVQIFLSDSMANKYLSLYKNDYTQSFVLSNIYFSKKEGSLNYKINAKKNNGIQYIFGHLSNLCLEKGTIDSIEFVRILRRNNIQAELHLAGPIVCKKTKEAIDFAIQEGWVQYFGAVYNSEKDIFYQNIDIFLFPTKYINEAQPIVLFEAVNSYKPFISINKGSIAFDFKNTEFSIIFNDSESFLQFSNTEAVAHKLNILLSVSPEKYDEYLKNNLLKDQDSFSSFVTYIKGGLKS